MKYSKDYLDAIEQLETYIQEIEKAHQQYTNSLTSNDFIYNMADSRPLEFRNLFIKRIMPILEKYKLEKINSDQLVKLFNAVQTIDFYSEGSEHAKTLDDILSEALKRESIKEVDSWHTVVYESYIKTRQFEKAKQLAERYSKYSFKKLPKIKDQDAKDKPNISLMQLHDNGQILTRKPFLIPLKGHIIVIGHPLCHFSQNALSTILSDSDLKPIFVNHSTWIMPSSGSLDVDEVLKSNNKFPIKYNYVYHESEWPNIDYWGTPAFYFYQNGKLLKKIIGWPHEGRKKEILEAIQSINLTTP